MSPDAVVHEHTMMIKLFYTSIALSTMLSCVVYPVTTDGTLEYFHFWLTGLCILHSYLQHLLNLILSVLTITNRHCNSKQNHCNSQSNVQYRYYR